MPSNLAEESADRGARPTPKRVDNLNGAKRLAALAHYPRYEVLNTVITILAVFSLPLISLSAHLFAPSQLNTWLHVAVAVQIFTSAFFAFDIVVGFAATGPAYARSSEAVINVLAIAGVIAGTFFGVAGLANARILRILRTERPGGGQRADGFHAAKDTVLGAEVLRHMHDDDTWYALILLTLMVALGQFSPGTYGSSTEALVEIAVYAGFAIAVRWKAERNRVQVEGALVERLREANRELMARMHEIPGLEDADRLVAERATIMHAENSRVSEIEIMVESIGMIVSNLRRFISRRAFAEAKGEVVLPPGRSIALMFTDVEGFSRVTQAMQHEVIPVLQKYLGDMSQGVLQHQGDVDKFIGDALFAYFDDPDNSSNSCNLAFDAMLAIHAQCALLADNDEQWGALFAGMPQWHQYKYFRTRIGLHCGTVVAGPIGSPHRADSTLVGDDVNLCARLEDLCKKYGTYHLLSNAFYASLSPERQQRCRWIDRVTVAGREDSPFDLYTLDLQPLPSSFLLRFNNAVERYLGGDWHIAHAELSTGQAQLISAGAAPDQISQALLARIESNRTFWGNAVEHVNERAPDLLTADLKRLLIERRGQTPFQAPVSWRGYWRHEK